MILLSNVQTRVSSVVLLMPFSGPASNPGSHIAAGYCVSSVSFNLILFLSLSLSFMILTLLKTSGQLFCRLSFNLGFRHLTIRVRVHILAEMQSRCALSAPLREYVTLLRLVTGDVNLDHVIRVAPARFLYYTVTVFLFVVSSHLVRRRCFEML